MSQVKIYTTSTCVYCQLAKQFLKENNIEYQEFNVGEDEKAREEMLNKTGQFIGVPVIEIDGEMMLGFDKVKVKKLLNLS